MLEEIEQIEKMATENAKLASYQKEMSNVLQKMAKFEMMFRRHH